MSEETKIDAAELLDFLDARINRIPGLVPTYDVKLHRNAARCIRQLQADVERLTDDRARDLDAMRAAAAKWLETHGRAQATVIAAELRHGCHECFDAHFSTLVRVDPQPCPKCIDAAVAEAVDATTEAVGQGQAEPAAKYDSVPDMLRGIAGEIEAKDGPRWPVGSLWQVSDRRPGDRILCDYDQQSVCLRAAQPAGQPEPEKWDVEAVVEAIATEHERLMPESFASFYRNQQSLAVRAILAALRRFAPISEVAELRKKLADLRRDYATRELHIEDRDAEIERLGRQLAEAREKGRINVDVFDAVYKENQMQKQALAGLEKQLADKTLQTEHALKTLADAERKLREAAEQPDTLVEVCELFSSQSGYSRLLRVFPNGVWDAAKYDENGNAKLICDGATMAELRDHLKAALSPPPDPRQAAREALDELEACDFESPLYQQRIDTIRKALESEEGRER